MWTSFINGPTLNRTSHTKWITRISSRKNSCGESLAASTILKPRATLRKLCEERRTRRSRSRSLWSRWESRSSRQSRSAPTTQVRFAFANIAYREDWKNASPLKRKAGQGAEAWKEEKEKWYWDQRSPLRAFHRRPWRRGWRRRRWRWIWRQEMIGSFQGA